MLASVFILLKGMAIGVAQIIPGVSGGTLALILGIFEQFIGAINAVSSAFLALLSWMWGFRKERWHIFVGKLREVQWGFIIFLTLGMLFAILATSGLIIWLLENHQAPTYGVFFGLIVASLIVPWEMMGRRRWQELVAFLFGLVLLFWVSGLRQDLPRVLDAPAYQSALDRTAHPGKKVLLQKAYKQTQDGFVLRQGLSDTEEEDVSKLLQQSAKPVLWFLFIAGAVSISAMILPGLSGSFVLLIMGCYGYVVGLLNLLKTMDFSVILPLAVFSLGLLVGAFSFARLMEFLLRKYHSVTMAFLIGLMLGSLRKIFPFSPGMGGSALAGVIVAIVVGMAVVLALHFASRSKKNAA